MTAALFSLVCIAVFFRLDATAYMDRGESRSPRSIKLTSEVQKDLHEEGVKGGLLKSNPLPSASNDREGARDDDAQPTEYFGSVEETSEREGALEEEPRYASGQAGSRDDTEPHLTDAQKAAIAQAEAAEKEARRLAEESASRPTSDGGAPNAPKPDPAVELSDAQIAAMKNAEAAKKIAEDLANAAH